MWYGGPLHSVIFTCTPPFCFHLPLVHLGDGNAFGWVGLKGLSWHKISSWLIFLMRGFQGPQIINGIREVFPWISIWCGSLSAHRCNHKIVTLTYRYLVHEKIFQIQLRVPSTNRWDKWWWWLHQLGVFKLGMDLVMGCEEGRRFTGSPQFLGVEVCEGRGDKWGPLEGVYVFWVVHLLFESRNGHIQFLSTLLQ